MKKTQTHKTPKLWGGDRDLNLRLSFVPLGRPSLGLSFLICQLEVNTCILLDTKYKLIALYWVLGGTFFFF